MRNRLSILLSFTLLLGIVGLAEAGWDEGVSAYKAGNFSKAAQEFEAVVEAQPDFAGGHFMLGQALLRLHKGEQALNALRKAYELDPKNTSFQLALGRGYLEAKRYSEAAQILRKVNESSLSKEQQRAYQQMLVVALDKSGQDEAALDALKKLAESNPNDASAWFTYGAQAVNNGDLTEGLNALEKAVRLDPKDPQKKAALVKAYIRQARQTRSSDTKKAVYTKAVSPAESLVSSTASFDNLLLLAEVQLGAHQYDGAISTLNKAITKNNSDFYAQYYRSQALTAKQQYSQADSAAQNALQQAGKEREKKLAWTQIGFVNEKLKNYDEAITAYTNAGDPASVRRVQENKKIAEENKEAEAHNKEVDRLEAEKKKLEEELKKLPGGPPPHDR